MDLLARPSVPAALCRLLPLCRPPLLSGRRQPCPLRVTLRFLHRPSTWRPLSLFLISPRYPTLWYPTIWPTFILLIWLRLWLRCSRRTLHFPRHPYFLTRCGALQGAPVTHILMVSWSHLWPSGLLMSQITWQPFLLQWMIFSRGGPSSPISWLCISYMGMLNGFLPQAPSHLPTSHGLLQPNSGMFIGFGLIN